MSTPKTNSAKALANPTHPEFKLEHSPFYLLTQVHGHYTLAMERSLKAVGMDLPRWRVLMILHEKSPSTVSEISRRSALKLSTMTRVAQRLARDGYVRLSQNKTDGRSTDVHLLDKGERAVVTIREAASRVFARSTEHIDDSEMTALLETLRKLYDALLTQS